MYLLLEIRRGTYTSDKNNYRPIALFTVASKLFEICILEILETYYLSSAVYIFRFQDGVYLAIYTCLFRWCYGHFYNRLTQFIVYCSYVVCTILLRRPVDLSTHWTVTAISLHVTTFVGVCHE